MPKPLEAWGRNVYVYSNIRTNQTVYSLTPVLDNHKALKQIPYLGKKTVEPVMRKDLWHPLALLSFPQPQQGLKAFHHLREFKKLHELSWDKDDFRQESNPNNLLPMKQRGKKLMNQKANSIADMAAVLRLQEKAGEEWSATKVETEANDERLRKQAISQGRPVPKKVGRGYRFANLEGVTIKWRDLHDAEFAESWPERVVHDGLPRSRHRMPLRDALVSQGQEQEVAS